MEKAKLFLDWSERHLRKSRPERGGFFLMGDEKGWAASLSQLRETLASLVDKSGAPPLAMSLVERGDPIASYLLGSDLGVSSQMQALL